MRRSPWSNRRSPAVHLFSRYPRYAHDVDPLGYLRFNPNSGFILPSNANGGVGQFVYNLNKWIGGVVDLGAVIQGCPQRFNVDTEVRNIVGVHRTKFKTEVLHYGPA